MPASIQSNLATWWGPKQATLSLQLWDIETGKLAKQINTTIHDPNLTSDQLAAKFQGMLSRDGNWAVLHDQDVLMVLDLRHARSWLCWLIVTIFILLSVWIAWPRRSRILK